MHDVKIPPSPELACGSCTTLRARAEQAERRLETREDQLAEIARALGCEEEWTSAHDHGLPGCWAERIAHIQGRAEQAEREVDACRRRIARALAMMSEEEWRTASAPTTAEIERDIAAKAESAWTAAEAEARLVTIIDEAFGYQPVQPIQDLLTFLERRLFEDRQERERLRGALEEALQMLEGQSQRPSRIARIRAALAGEGEVHQTAEGGKCRTTCRTVTQRVNSDWCIECRREMERRAETETLPFCACGRRVSECDGSRAGCATPEKASQP